jgi:hypothetical protein
MSAEQALNRNVNAGEHKTSTKHAEMDGDRRRLERSEDLVQMVLAAVVPGLLAMMMFSYFLIPELTPYLMLSAVAAAALMVVPADRMRRLHYRTWCQDSLVPKLVTSVVGMIYISIVSIFAVAMMSFFKGLDPEQPTTLAAVGSLVIMLLGVMGYSSRTKDAYLRTEKRFFHHPPEAVEERLALRLAKEGHEHTRSRGPKGALFQLEGGLHVHVRPLGRRESEVLVRNIDDSNKHLLPKLKACVEGA